VNTGQGIVGDGFGSARRGCLKVNTHSPVARFDCFDGIRTHDKIRAAPWKMNKQIAMSSNTAEKPTLKQTSAAINSRMA
jgi:hypothetical protein